MVLGNVYRLPTDNNIDYKNFVEEFATSLIELVNSNSELIIAGDFNINLLKLNERNFLRSSLTLYQLLVYIHESRYQQDFPIQTAL